MQTILDKIIAAKRRRIEAAKGQADLSALARAAFERRRSAAPNRLSSALRARSRVNIIAEMKRASPSKGIISESAEIESIAINYRRGGAAAISILTEEDHFLGTIQDLRTVRSAVPIPVLQKDFFIDEFQIFESAAFGADAVLLIVAALPVKRLVELQKTANDLGLDAIVEVHDGDEMETAIEIGAKIIGVNNRDLKTFKVFLDVSRGLAKNVPKNVLLISESGISTTDQITELREIGYSGFLIGESLMRSEDPRSMLQKLSSFDADILECSTTL